MNITAAEIDWADGFANSPRLIVTTDGPLPKRADLRYEEVFLTARTSGLSREQEVAVGTREMNLHVLYAEHPSGYVSFIRVGTETSYPGAAGGDFTLTDGRELHVRSGWVISSRAIRDHADVVECVYHEGPRHGLVAGFITAKRAREIVAEFLPDVEMFDDGTGWTFKWAAGPTKAEWQREEYERAKAAGERGPGSIWPARRYSEWREREGARA